MEIKILPQPAGRLSRSVSALFQKDNKWYYADLSDCLDVGNECMIFPANKNGKVTSWTEVYCNRESDEISEENLLTCIKEFCEG